MLFPPVIYWIDVGVKPETFKSASAAQVSFDPSAKDAQSILDTPSVRSHEPNAYLEEATVCDRSV
jgi:hypothetical protein